MSRVTPSWYFPGRREEICAVPRLRIKDQGLESSQRHYDAGPCEFLLGLLLCMIFSLHFAFLKTWVVLTALFAHISWF
jgi:hypothetical protein